MNNEQTQPNSHFSFTILRIKRSECDHHHHHHHHNNTTPSDTLNQNKNLLTDLANNIRDRNRRV